MKKNANTQLIIFIIVALLIFLPIVLPLLGFSIGGSNGSSIEEAKLKSSYESQLNKPWQKIDSSYKFVEIIDALPDHIWAKAINGNLYHWEFKRCDTGNRECGEWLEIENLPENREFMGNPFEKGKSCPRLEPSFKEIPSSVVECALGSYQVQVWVSTYYVLLEDGTIWYWKVPVGSDFRILGLIYGIYGSIAGLIIGLVLDVIIVITLLIPSIKKLRKG